VAEFFGPAGAQMLGVTHLPAGKARAGLVVCSSVRAEFETNYRREILLGRTLAAAGIAVQRFQYRGTGNSDGDTSAVTLDTMKADARSATEHFRSTTGVEDIAFMGTKLSGVVAASLASAHGGAPLVLWEPVQNGARHFKQLFRVRKMWSLSDDDDAASGPSAMEEFTRDGSIDIVGYPIDKNLYDGFVAASLTETSADALQRVLIVQLGGRDRHGSLAAALSDTGATVERAIVDETESWWLEHPGERQSKRTMNSSPAIDATVAWLAARFAEERSR
jgi:hypothetical protein